jgi:hypothetical protein
VPAAAPGWRSGSRARCRAWRRRPPCPPRATSARACSARPAHRLRQLGAHGAGGEHLAGLRHLPTTVTPKPCAAPALRSVSDRRAALAEPEVVARPPRGARRGPCTSTPGDEVARPSARQGRVRSAPPPPRPAEPLQQRQLAGEWRQGGKCGLSGWKTSRGCGSNTMDAGRPGPGAAPRHGRSDQLPGGLGARRRSCRSPARHPGRGRDVHRAVDTDHRCRNFPAAPQQARYRFKIASRRLQEWVRADA